MRISDGSSDVCSSDLIELCLLRGGGEIRIFRKSGECRSQGTASFRLQPGRSKERTPHGFWRKDQGQGLFIIIGLRKVHDERNVWQEIGRASCRERVCQYV